VLLVYIVYVRQSTERHCSLTTLSLIYNNLGSWRHPHLQRKNFVWRRQLCAITWLPFSV